MTGIDFSRITLCDGEIPQADRLTFVSPITGDSLEDARALLAAESATAVLAEIPVAEYVPISTDQPLTAVVTIRAVPVEVVDVPRIRVSDAVLPRDLPGAL